MSPECKALLDTLGGFYLEERGPVTLKVVITFETVWNFTIRPHYEIFDIFGLTESTPNYLPPKKHLARFFSVCYLDHCLFLLPVVPGPHALVRPLLLSTPPPPSQLTLPREGASKDEGARLHHHLSQGRK